MADQEYILCLATTEVWNTLESTTTHVLTVILVRWVATRLLIHLLIYYI